MTCTQYRSGYRIGGKTEMDGDGNGGAEELLELTRDSVYAGCAFFFFLEPL